MLKLAICDEEVIFTDVIAELAEDHFKTLNYKVVINTYYSGKYLLDAALNNLFDIVLLDIEMPEIDGKHCAKLLKQIYPDIQIAFITSHDEELKSSYDYNVNGFISKTECKDQLPVTLNRFIKNIEKINERKMKHFFEVQNENGESQTIFLRDAQIIFFESLKRKVFVTTNSETFQLVKKGIHEIQTQFARMPFAVPHDSYVVNLNYITRICNNLITLEGTVNTIPLSRTRKKQFTNAYVQMFTKPYGEGK